MKIVTLLFFLVLLFIGVVAVQETGDNVHDVEKETTDSLRGSSQDERNLKNSKINVVVEFKTTRGKKDAMKMARKVTYESTLFNIVAMQMYAKDLDTLKEDPNIVRVDYDEKVHAIRPPINATEIVTTSEEKKNKDRLLQENIPWGIRAVQADRVSPGPDIGTVKVCIVDTGYDITHEDLPKSGIVSGTDSRRYSSSDGFRWSEDGDGHGTHIGKPLFTVYVVEVNLCLPCFSFIGPFQLGQLRLWEMVVE